MNSHQGAAFVGFVLAHLACPNAGPVDLPPPV